MIYKGIAAAHTLLGSMSSLFLLQPEQKIDFIKPDTQRWAVTSTNGEGRLYAVRRDDGLFDVLVENHQDSTQPCIIMLWLEMDGIEFQPCQPELAPEWV